MPGRLAATTLGDLLGALHRERVTGLLELTEIRGPRGCTVPGRVHRIHLRMGLVAAVETPLAVPVREALEAIFAVEDAAITFRTARPIAHAPPSPLLPRDFLHGRPRARDRGRAAASPRREPPQASRREAHDETPPPRSGVRVVQEDAKDRARRALGIALGADMNDVRRAFRRLAATLHPDRFSDASPVEQQKRALRFAELSAAYHLLVA
ncbi:Hypothetical protein A7982_03991 [Minicystis rosea]|nr:Hypothetical protein A7982_03991 [Minicystis rosea]